MAVLSGSDKPVIQARVVNKADRLPEAAPVEMPPEADAIVTAAENGQGRAEALFLKYRQDKRIAQAALRALNERKNHAIVLALTGALPDDDKLQEYALIERAVALAQAESREAAAEFLRANAGLHARSYAFQFNAGRVLQDADAAHRALPFLETAMSIKRTPQVADRMFVCLMRIGKMREAARVLGPVLELGSYRSSLRRDIAAALRRMSPDDLEPATLNKLLEQFGTDLLIAPALLPHFMAAGRGDVVAAIAGHGAIDPKGWEEGILLQTAVHLEAHGQSDLALRLLCRCGGQSDAFAAQLGRMLDRFTPEQLKTEVLPILAVPEDRYSAVVHADPYLEIARRFARENDIEGTLDTLLHMKDALDATTAGVFYARNRDRIAPLFALIAGAAAGNDAMLDRLASLVVFGLDANAKRVFAGSELERGLDDLALAARMAEAAPGSRTATLRDGYFRYQMERREGVRMPARPGDMRLCEHALQYFRSMRKTVPVELVPVGEELRGRLGRPALSLEGERRLDTLMTWCAMRDGTPQQEEDETGRKLTPEDVLVWRYVGKTMPAESIPSSAIGDSILADFNTVTGKNELPGINVTKFGEATSRRVEPRRRHDTTTPVDSILVFLELLASVLAGTGPYRAFLAPMVPDADTPEYAFLERCLTVLAGDRRLTGIIRPEPIVGADILNALLGKEAVAKSPAKIAGAPQDVLLVGHASRSTGLGRNFRMLGAALAGGAADGIAMQELDYEAAPRELLKQLRGWRRSCRSRPIVVYAVNAHDIASIFLKDRHGDLMDAYGIGFFLWETSRVPDVQRLGVALMDEVWSPTKYVADIYAPLARTHIVGKGLFESATPPPTRDRRSPQAAFRFVTVFDFDSSIERKNPLAAVLAFKQAFTGGEKVELVVKGSAINPDHWSNALGHWERLNDAIAGDPRITTIPSRYSEAEMERLLRGSACFVSLHRAEGFGYVVADAMALGVPVIATDYSGNADFCTAETSFPVAHRLIPVDSRAVQWRATDAEWADPDVASAAARMREVFGNYERALEVAAKGREALLAAYDTERFHRNVVARIKDIAASF